MTELQPSLRDVSNGESGPGSELPGYSHLSLREISNAVPHDPTFRPRLCCRCYLSHISPRPHGRSYTNHTSPPAVSPSFGAGGCDRPKFREQAGAGRQAEQKV